MALPGPTRGKANPIPQTTRNSTKNGLCHRSPHQGKTPVAGWFESTLRDKTTPQFNKIIKSLTTQIVQMYRSTMRSIRPAWQPDGGPEPRANIVQLRDLLGQRFPRVRMTVPEKLPARLSFATGLPQMDGLLQGGLPKGAITELVSPHGGGAVVLRRILRIAGQNRQRIALIDGSDGFDPCALNSELMAGLLWVRCSDATQALKAADLVLRDGN